MQFHGLAQNPRPAAPPTFTHPALLRYKTGMKHSSCILTMRLVPVVTTRDINHAELDQTTVFQTRAAFRA